MEHGIASVSTTILHSSGVISAVVGVLLGPFVQGQPPQSKSLRVLQTPIKD